MSEQNIYEEMGFSKILSERALIMFGEDNIQEASEWLLRHSTLGLMPKRFKDGKSDNFNYTFFKSKIQIEDEKYLISDYNSKYNIIEIEPYADNYTDPKWISLSDPSIVWIRERHCTKRVFQPVQDVQKHLLGEIYLPIRGAFLSDDDTSREKYNQMIQQFNTGLNGLGNLSYYYSRLHIYGVQKKELANIWLSFLHYTDKYNEQLRIEPDMPQPKSINQQRQRHVKTKMWSKMILILEINGIPSHESSQLLATPNARASICELIQRGIDNETVSDLLELFKNYSRPRDYLKRLKRNWTNGCKSIFSVENGSFQNEIFSGNLYMSHHIFHRDSMAPESKFWIHLKNIFHLISWGKRLVDDTDNCLSENSVILTRNSVFEYVQLTLPEWGLKLLSWCKEDHQLYNPIQNDWPVDSFDHQKMALQWMMDKELKSLTNEKDNWKQVSLTSGFTFYKHLFGNITNKIPNLNQNGGILAQCVGSGKTYTSMQIIKYTNLNDNWRTACQTNKTLIIVPTSMIGSWVNECKKWAPNIGINVYHGNRRKVDDMEIYITTYRIICNELSSDAYNDTEFSNILWRRVILDEGHMIRNVHGKTFKSVMNLKMQKICTRWILTATPIIKSMMDMTAYYKFLQLYPFDSIGTSYRSCFSTMWALASYSESYPKIANLMKEMNKNIMFYQTRSDISRISSIFTPLVKDEHIFLEPSQNHKSLLDTLFEMTKARFKINAPISHMIKLKWIGWLRRAALDPNFIPMAAYGIPLEKKSAGGVSVTVTDLDKLIPTLSSVSEEFGKNILNNLKNKDSKCPVCLDVIDCPTVTSCGHVFCSECINLTFINQTGHVKVCPCCRTQLQNSILHEINMNPIESYENNDFTIIEDIMVGASKISKHIVDQLDIAKNEINLKNKKIIDWIRLNNKKIIIFTNYSKSVQSISKELKQNDIKYSLIDGSMSVKQRTTSIYNFQNDEDVKVFILSKRCASIGISLTAASTIVFYEPCMNKAYRKQCIGRIQRIGQRADVLNIITLVMKNSVEEKLVENKISLHDLNLV